MSRSNKILKRLRRLMTLRTSRDNARSHRRGSFCGLEPLEQRILLSGDFNYTAVDNTPLTLSVAGINLVVLDSNNLGGTPLASTAVASVSAGVCIDSDGNNVDITIDGSVPSNIGGVTLIGGSGTNTLDASAYTGDTTLDGGDGNDILNGGVGNDTYIVGAGLGADTLTDAGGSVDKIQATSSVNGNLTITGTTVTATGPSGTIASFSSSDIEAAELVGGSGSNTIKVDGFTGTLVLRGQGGSDTYEFGNNFGNVTVDDAGGGTLDFTTGFLSNSGYSISANVNNAGDTVYRGFDNTDTHVGTVTVKSGGTFVSDLVLPAAIDLTHLADGLGWLGILGDTIDNDESRLVTPVPLLAGRTLGELIDVGGFIRTELRDNVTALSSPTLDELVHGIDQFNVGGVNIDVTALLDGNVLAIDFLVAAERDLAGLEMALGDQLEQFLVAENLTGTLKTLIDWDFTVKVDGGAGADATQTFSVDLSGAGTTDLLVEAQVNDTNASFSARAGLLGLGIGTTGTSTIKLEGATGGAPISFSVDTSTLGTAAGMTQLVMADLSTFTVLNPSEQANVRVDLFVATPGVTGLTATTPEIHFADDLFDGADPAAITDTATPGAANTTNFATLGLTDFLNSDPVVVANQLEFLSNFLLFFDEKALETSSLPVPLASGTTLGDLFDLDREFRIKVIDAIQTKPLASTTTLASLNRGFGVRTVTGADFVVQLRSGVSFEVDLNPSPALTTVGDLLTHIVSSGPGSALFDAQLDEVRGGFLLIDKTIGGKSFSVEAVNGSPALTDLGLTAPARSELVNNLGPFFVIASDLGNAGVNFETVQELAAILGIGSNLVYTAGNPNGSVSLPFSVDISATVLTGTVSKVVSGTKLEAAGAGLGTDGGMVGRLIEITGGTGLGQVRRIVANALEDEATDTHSITVDSAWSTALDNTSQYKIRSDFGADLAMFDIGPLQGLQTTDDVSITPSGTLEVPLELLLSPIGGAVTESTSINTLSGGAGVGVAASRAAMGTLELATNPADGDTVTIGSRTYMFQTVLTDSNGHVKIGTDTAQSLANLFAAINLGPGRGTAYASSTSLHTTVRAEAVGTTELIVQAKTAGSAGNSIATSSSIAGVWKDPTLTVGAEFDDIRVQLLDGTTFSVDLDHNPTEIALADLGVALDGSGADLTITLSGGTSFDIQLEQATTVGDVIQLIESAFASHAAANGGIANDDFEIRVDHARGIITLIDYTDPGMGNLLVANAGSATAAAELGLAVADQLLAFEGRDAQAIVASYTDVGDILNRIRTAWSAHNNDVATDFKFQVRVNSSGLGIDVLDATASAPVSASATVVSTTVGSIVLDNTMANLFGGNGLPVDAGQQPDLSGYTVQFSWIKDGQPKTQTRRIAAQSVDTSVNETELFLLEPWDPDDSDLTPEGTVTLLLPTDVTALNSAPARANLGLFGPGVQQVINANSVLADIGTGVTFSTTPSDPDLQVQLSGGPATAFTVDLDGSVTVQDVLNKISAASTSNQFDILSDLNSGAVLLADFGSAVGSFTLTSLNGSNIVEMLGIGGPGVQQQETEFFTGTVDGVSGATVITIDAQIDAGELVGNVLEIDSQKREIIANFGNLVIVGSGFTDAAKDDTYRVLAPQPLVISLDGPGSYALEGNSVTGDEPGRHAAVATDGVTPHLKTNLLLSAKSFAATGTWGPLGVGINSGDSATLDADIDLNIVLDDPGNEAGAARATLTELNQNVDLPDTLIDVQTLSGDLDVFLPVGLSPVPASSSLSALSDFVKIDVDDVDIVDLDAKLDPVPLTSTGTTASDDLKALLEDVQDVTIQEVTAAVADVAAYLTLLESMPQLGGLENSLALRVPGLGVSPAELISLGGAFDNLIDQLDLAAPGTLQDVEVVISDVLGTDFNSGSPALGLVHDTANKAIQVQLTGLGLASVFQDVPFFLDLLSLDPFEEFKVAEGSVTSDASDATLTDSNASFDNSMVGMTVRIIAGTGSGQERTINAVTSGTVLALDSAWTTPIDDSDSKYQIIDTNVSLLSANLTAASVIQDMGSVVSEFVDTDVSGLLDVSVGVLAPITGTVTTAGGSAILIDSAAAFASTGLKDLVGLTVEIVAGTGQGQIRTITGVTSATELAVDSAWGVPLAADSEYLIRLPAFLYGGAGVTDLTLTLKAGNTDLDFFTLMRSTQVEVVNGSYALHRKGDSSSGANFGATLSSNKRLSGAAGSTAASLDGELNTTLPLDYPASVPAADPIQPIQLVSADLKDGSGSVFRLSGPDVDNDLVTVDLRENLDGFRQGFDILLTELDKVLDTALFDITPGLPLVGDQLADAIDLAPQIMDKLGDNFDTVTEVLTPDSARLAIFEAFGPGGLGWLQDGNDTGTDVSLDDVKLSAAADLVTFTFDLERSVSPLSYPIDLDLALPDFGLTIEGQADVDFGFKMPVVLGFSTGPDGAFLGLDDSNPEIEMTLQVELPAAATGTGLAAQFGILPYIVKDGDNDITGDVDSATSTTLVDSSMTFSDVAIGQEVKITAGTGMGQVRTITAVNTSTGTLTVDKAWDSNKTPDSTSDYQIISRTFLAGTFTVDIDKTLNNTADFGDELSHIELISAAASNPANLLSSSSGFAGEGRIDLDLRTDLPAINGARTTLTFTNQPADAETFTIAGVQYEFEATALDLFKIHIESDLSKTIDLIIKIVNHGQVNPDNFGLFGGTQFLIDPHPHVRAARGPGNSVIFQTKDHGPVTNGLFSASENIANATFSSATLNGATDGAELPAFRMNISVPKWTFTNSNFDTGGSQPTINVDPVEFELVSFMRDYVGPSLTRIRTAMQPLDGVVDFLNSSGFFLLNLFFGWSPYAGATSFGGDAEIGNFAGASNAIRAIVEGGNPYEGNFATELVDTLAELVTLDFLKDVDLPPIDLLAGEGWINMGSFTVSYSDATSGSGVLSPTTSTVVEFGKLSDSLSNGTIMGQINSIASNTSHSAHNAALAFIATQELPGIQAISGVIGLSLVTVINAFGGTGFDPIEHTLLKSYKDTNNVTQSRLFELLLGDLTPGGTSSPETTVLWSYGTPELFVRLQVNIPLSIERFVKKLFPETEKIGPIPISGSAGPYIVIAFEAKADFQAYVDATGLEKFASTRNVVDIRDGFFFDDTEGVQDTPSLLGIDTRDGVDVDTGFDPNFGDASRRKDEDQSRILGGLGLGYKIDVRFGVALLNTSISLGTEAVFFIGESLNFIDPDGDKRVRASEFDLQLLQGQSTPPNFDKDDIYEVGIGTELRWDVNFLWQVSVLFIGRASILDIRINLISLVFPNIILNPNATQTPPTLATVTANNSYTNSNTDSFDEHDFLTLVGSDPSSIDTLKVDLSTASSDIVYVGPGSADNKVIVSNRVWIKEFSNIELVEVTGSSSADEIFISPTLTLPVIVYGLGGADTIKAGGGAAFIEGGDGADTITGSTFIDFIFGGSGADNIFGDDGTDVLIGGTGPDTIKGWRDDDLIYGDQVSGSSGGADTIDGGTGNDAIFAGPDADTVDGGLGNDTIDGGAGADTITGGDGRDDIKGGSGGDTISGGLGNDTLDGGSGADTINGDGHRDTIAGGTGNDILDGNGASDIVYGDNGPPNADPSGDDIINAKDGHDFLDGQGGSDTYLLGFVGGLGDTLVTVLDTGDSSGTDLFTATGTVDDDEFLLRTNNNGSRAFVALINSTDRVERIDYSGVERIVISGGLGDDFFAVDDTSAEITLNGDTGNDTFQIGQLFRSPRTFVAANVSVDDEFATLETTRGFLSNGVSAPMTVNGGSGADSFVVYHNLAVLTLNGDAGDDSFEIKAFALIGSQEPERARTDISGGGGADLVMYAVNAPVNIDGGDGFDTLIATGTEFGDDFVITKNGVFGAGLNVNFANIESLRVDGAEGDDRFFIKSTDPNVVTEIFGGLGNDTFNASGDAPPVVSNDLLGHSGIITHSVTAVDPAADAAFDGIKLHGISANVGDNDEPAVAIRESDGATIVTEGGVADTYQVVLTSQPAVDIFVKVLAPIPTDDERELRARAFSVDSDHADAVTTNDGTSVTLKFTTSNWNTPQTVKVAAGSASYTDAAGLLTRPELGDGTAFTFDDSAFEGRKFGVINHTVFADVASEEGGLDLGTQSRLEGARRVLVELSGTVNDGNDFTITIGSDVVTYTADSNDTAADVLAGLATAVNTAALSDPVFAFLVRETVINMPASPTTGNDIKITFADLGLDFTYTIQVTDLTSEDLAESVADFLNSQNLVGVTVEANTALSGSGAIVISDVNLDTITESGAPGNPTVNDRLVLNSDDANILTDDTTDFAVSTTNTSISFDIRVDGGNGNKAILELPIGTDIIGRSFTVVSGPAAGESRFVIANNSGVITLDRPWDPSNLPTSASTFLVRIDDALVGTGATADNVNFTFTDSTNPFPTTGTGLAGRTLEIVGGTGSGQRILILSNTSSQLTLAGAWSVAPDTGSIYRIERFDGLAIPSVQVQINDNDEAGIIITQSKAETSVIEGGDETREMDTIDVRLTKATDSGKNVTVDLNSAGGNLTFDTSKLTFSNADGTTTKSVTVSATDDTIREGAHTDLIEFIVTGGPTDTTSTQKDTFTIGSDTEAFLVGLSFLPSSITSVTVGGTAQTQGTDFKVIENKIVFIDSMGDPRSVTNTTVVVDYSYLIIGFASAATPTVLTRISDDDAPTVLVRESGGSTDVIESSSPGAIHTDSYDLVLTAAPTSDIIVTVTPEITKTTRTGGIRHDLVQVALSSTDTRFISHYTVAITGTVDGDDEYQASIGTTSISYKVDAQTDSTLADIATGLAAAVNAEGLTGVVADATAGDGTLTINVSGGDELTVGVVTDNGAQDAGITLTLDQQTVTFGATGWDNPVQVDVEAIDDAVVDGGDTKVFAPGPNSLSEILGPVILEGGGGDGSLGAEDPVLLAGETNVKTPDGSVVTLSGVQMTVLESNLNAAVARLGLNDLQDLIDNTVEVAASTVSSALGSFRRIVGVTDGATGEKILTVNEPFIDNIDRYTVTLAGTVEAGDQYTVLFDGAPITYTVTGSEASINEIASALTAAIVGAQVKGVTATAATNVMSLEVDPTINVSAAVTVDGSNTDSEITLALATPVALNETQITGFAITTESLNFFVKEEEAIDVLFVHDEDSPADSTGLLTANRLSGLNMGPANVDGRLFPDPGGRFRAFGITYGDLEVMDIELGSGLNTLTVQGTPTRDDGYQTWTTINTGDDIPDPNTPSITGDTVNITLVETDTVTVDDATLGSAFSAAASDPVSGLATLSFASDVLTTDGSLKGQIVRIGGMGGQERRILSNTASKLTVEGIWETIPDGNQTIEIVDEADGNIAVNTEGGDDTINAGGSTLGLVLFGGLGADTITTGSGDDIIFGDRGRVDYYGPSVAGTSVRPIVTRLGSAPGPITGVATGDFGNDATLLDANASFPVPDTFDIGLRGLFVDINNGTGFLQTPRLVTNNSATNLDINPNFTETLDNTSAYRISTFPEDQTDGVIRDANLLVTVDDNLGGADTIVAGGGADQIFGGAGGDQITADAGADVVIGDAGVVEREGTGFDVSFVAGASVPVTTTSLDRIRTKSTSDGGADIITGDSGDDVILGGAGADQIDGNLDADIIFGDFGEVDYNQGTLEDMRSTDSVFGDADTIGGQGGANIIFGGANGNMTQDTITASNGDNIVFADFGVIDYSVDGNLADIDLIDSIDPTVGGDDKVTLGNGTNIIIGGAGVDTLIAGDGRNIVLGDNGTLTADTDGNAVFGNILITIGQIETTDPTVGGADSITTGTGDDIVLGGHDGDTITASDLSNLVTTGDHNIVVGDDGKIVYDSDGDASDIDVIESLSTTAAGGADTVDTGHGDDLVIGGRLGDTITARDGDNLIIGDSGKVTAAASGTPQIGGQPIVLGVVETVEFGDGGIDTINTLTGDDIVLGGHDGDTITASDLSNLVTTGDHNIVVGDDGKIVYDSDGDASDIDVIESLSTTAAGGADTVDTGHGDDLVIGGRLGDTITARDGDNLIIGDSGKVTAAASGTPQIGGQPIVLGVVETVEFGDGGIDTINTLTGDDIVLGGHDGDTITASDLSNLVTTGDHNIVVGDDGKIVYDSDGDASDIDVIESLSTTAAGGADTVDTGHGDDLVIGGRLGDTITARDGDNLIIGDSGKVTAAASGTPQIGGQPIVLGVVETVEFGDGGIDTINTLTGDDIVLGGHDGDTITASDLSNLVTTGDHNIVVGDDGKIVYDSDGDASDIDVIESLSTTAAGGADTVDTGHGDDLVIGGRLGDTITARDGDNLIIGDSGKVTAAASGTPQIGGQPIVLGVVETVEFGDGGIDTINTLTGDDIVLGGHDGDTITASDLSNLVTTGDHNIVVGDDGKIVYDSDGDASDIDVIESLSTTAAGGADTVDTGHGDDLVIGGRLGDTITARDGDNLIIGDSGKVTAAASGTPQIGGQPIVLGVVETVEFGDGGIDTINTLTGDDIVLGGHDGDMIGAGDGNNVVIGDNGKLVYDDLVNPDPSVLDLITTTAADNGGADDITVGTGADIVLGGTAGDTIHAGAGNDLVFGDNAKVEGAIDAALLPLETLTPAFTFTAIDIDNVNAGDDTIHGEADKDILIGQQGGDTIFGGTGEDDIIGGHNVSAGHDGHDNIAGGAGDDVITGDNAIIARLPLTISTSPRIRVLAGTEIYTTDAGTGEDGVADITTAQRLNPTGVAERAVTILDHSDSPNNDTFGNDYIAGGADDDVIFGQLGDDTIQGDGSIDSKVNPIDVAPAASGTSHTLTSLAGAATVFDGSSGNVVSDADNTMTIIGHGLTDGDLVAYTEDTSAVAGLTNGALYAVVVLDSNTIQLTQPAAAARDSANDLRVIPSVDAATDGDDYIEGNGGNDLIFGNLGQDDIVGGSSDLFALNAPSLRPDGGDVIFGGSATEIDRNNLGNLNPEGHARDADTILGDNGNIFRLVGINGADSGDFLTFTYDNYDMNLTIIPRAVVQLDYTPGDNGGSPTDIGAGDTIRGEAGDDQIWAMTGEDVAFGDGQDDDIIGGDGVDRLYGGAGEDGMVGDNGLVNTSRNGDLETLHGLTTANAEETLSISGPFVGAVEYIAGRIHKSFSSIAWEDGGDDVMYGGLGDDFMHAGAGDDAVSGAEALPAFFNHIPQADIDPDLDALNYDPVTTKFSAYDANNPYQKIADFFLNFEAVDSNLMKVEDGKDRIFGDLGNDWLVGGTGKDRMFGGLGDDLTNADDNHDTNSGANDGPDAPDFADGDFVYGGGGRDVLIGNTGNDRLVDFKGEFNSFWVPFSEFGLPTVQRLPNPQWVDFVTDLSRTNGADQTLSDPNSELGLVLDDTGSSRDPQPGNIGGVQIDTFGGPEDDRGVLPTDAGSTPGIGSGGTTPGNFVVFNNTTQTAITDEGTIISTIDVPDSTTILDLNVQLNITHNRVADLDVFLIAPNGIRIELFTDVGGNGDDFNGTTLDDDASTSIQNGSAPFSATYLPEGDLSLVEGNDMFGIWTLEITDDRKSQVGTLDSWNLIFEV